MGDGDVVSAMNGGKLYSEATEAFTNFSGAAINLRDRTGRPRFLKP